MIQFFARVVELREEKYVKYDGKVTTDPPSREFLEVTCCLPQCGGQYRVALFKAKVYHPMESTTVNYCIAED